MRISVIMTTYNSPRWLELVLWGYASQSHQDFEVIVADDGSTEETRETIEQVRQQTNLTIEHVWHEDKGFRKTRILNKAICATTTDYILFTDGDCVPRADFVRAHLRHARPEQLLSGGAFRLPMSVSQLITPELISSGHATDPGWLSQQGISRLHCYRKLIRSGWLARWCDRLTTTRPTFNGGNASLFKKHVLAANGFNEQLEHGGLDREFGARLKNLGLRCRQIRHQAVCVHLDHGRPYANKENIIRNRALRHRIEREKIDWTPTGILTAETRPADLKKAS
jgi:glycosyltransferase involved in cell wall biosynthesis